MDKRVRVRPLGRTTHDEVASANVRHRCLSVPHMGEEIDLCSDPYRAREGWTRVLHHLHPLDDPAADHSRCVFLDYVSADQPKDQDELDVAGLVNTGRAG